MIDQPDEHAEKLLISKADATSIPDRAAKGAVSRWLQTESVRMRIITFPPGYEGDHVCYKGHSIYVIAGLYKMELGNTELEWREGDAFIIPDDVPHRSFNPGETEAKIIMFDNHV